MQLLQAAAAALLLSATLARAGFCDEPSWEVIYADEFEGTALNDSSWTVLNHTVEEDSSCREAMCTTENVRVAGGALILTARRQQRGWAQYTTGAVNSKDKRFFQATPEKPFRLCVSGLLPGGKGTGAGLWPAFWLVLVPARGALPGGAPMRRKPTRGCQWWSPSSLVEPFFLPPPPPLVHTPPALLPHLPL
jgi:hypothetical protein